MIQVRRLNKDTKEEIFDDLSNEQLELVTNDGIYQFLGMKGMYAELRSENDIFDKDNETVKKLSNPLIDGVAEIYMSSEDNVYDRYTIAFTGANMAKLYLVEQKLMYKAVEFVAGFLCEDVSMDKSYLPVIEPVAIGIMCLTAYWGFDHYDQSDKDNICSTNAKFREAFDYAMANCVVTGYSDDPTWGLDNPLPDYSNPYARFCDIMRGYKE